MLGDGSWLPGGPLRSLPMGGPGQAATDPTKVDVTIDADSDHAVGCMRVHHSFRARLNARSRSTTAWSALLSE